MTTVVSSTELQRNTREIIDQARIKGEPVVIETYGKPMAAILSYEDYEYFLSLRAEKNERANRFALLKEAAKINAAYNQLTEEEAMRLVDEVRQEIWDEQHGKT